MLVLVLVLVLVHNIDWRTVLRRASDALPIVRPFNGNATEQLGVATEIAGPPSATRVARPSKSAIVVKGSLGRVSA